MARKEKTSKLKLSQSLSADDADYLKKNTNYSEEDLKAWYKWVEFGKYDLAVLERLHIFRKFQKDCPNGILEKKKVCEIYENKLKLSKDSKFLVDQLFRIIDDDNNGGIDFRVSQQSLCNAGIWSERYSRSLWWLLIWLWVEQKRRD